LQISHSICSEVSEAGYDRIQGALANVGHSVAPNTVMNILKRHGIEPAPEREKRTSWNTFLKAHWDVMAATDFFTVGVWSTRGLATYYVLFIINLSTRSVHIAGVTTTPARAFMKQMARNLIGNRLLEPLATNSANNEPIRRRERLGGMLNFYYREAA
jgi:putative transposase